jgi:hypothetical protein
MGTKVGADTIKLSIRDISPEEVQVQNRENFVQTKRNFEQIKVFNKYGNI